MDLSIKSVRNCIGFVPQDNFLFSDSIKNNVAFGKKDAKIEEIIDTRKKPDTSSTDTPNKKEEQTQPINSSFSFN